MRRTLFRPELEPLDDRSLPSLTLGATYAVDSVSLSVVTADFDNDGTLDLAAANGEVHVLPGAGDGTFRDPVNSPGLVPVKPVIGDFDGDGNDDLATMYIVWSYYNENGPYPPWGYWDAVCVDVCRGNGDGSFRPAQTIFAFDTGVSVELRTADSNGDGRADLGIDFLGLDPSYFIALLGNSDGSFEQTAGDPADFPRPPAPDLNGDGIGDVVEVVRVAGGFPGAGVSVALRRPDGSLMPAQVFPTGADVTGLTTGDFNGDGRVDVAASTFSSTVAVLFNDGIWLPTNTPDVRINDVLADEGHAGTRPFTFTVTLSAASAQTVTVDFQTANSTATAGSDYVAASGTLTFAPGETSKTIEVLVNGDRIPEPNETFFVNLSNPINAIIADGQGVGTIVDDEPRVSISDATKSEGRRNKTTLFTFTITLSAAYDQPVTMSFQTVNGTATTGDNDYVAKSGALTFAPGETTKTITIVVNGDSKKESNETFYLDLFGNSSNSLITKSRGIGTILNDD